MTHTPSGSWFHRMGATTEKALGLIDTRRRVGEPETFSNSEVKIGEDWEAHTRRSGSRDMRISSHLGL